MNELRAGQRVDDARRALAFHLKENGIETPDLDARLLIGEVLQLNLTGLMTANDRVLSGEESEKLHSMLRRRIASEPVARILGRKEFWGLDFRLSDATLVPRPDTEMVIEAALDLLRQHDMIDRSLRIADIGTGSGAILLALLSELPNATGIGTDISETALITARDNANRLGMQGRSAFVECDYTSALSGTFDLIVSNPPYIPTADIAALSIEVREHDPRLALDGGADGLAAYRKIIPQANALLSPGGFLIVEAGEGQAASVAEITTHVGLTLPCPPWLDLGGIPRAVAGQKSLNQRI